MSEALDIQLLGKDYRVACAPAEREALAAAVAFLDAKLNSIGGKSPAGGGNARGSGERVAVMAALNIAHELLQLKGAGGEAPVLSSAGVQAALSERLQRMESQLDAVLDEYQTAA
jgi:cell division protein ZapA